VWHGIVAALSEFVQARASFAIVVVQRCTYFVILLMSSRTMVIHNLGPGTNLFVTGRDNLVILDSGESELSKFP
jgi:hypothetical protein